MDVLQITYDVRGNYREIDEHARSLLIEQTIETPESVALDYPFVCNNLTGEIANITPNGDNGFLVTLSIPFLNASQSPAQFLNVLFGNASLHEHVTLFDFSLPESIKPLMSGPQFGLNGIRERVGIFKRPLTCSALKPLGLSVEEITVLFRRLAEGGIDLIKDDHYLSDQPFCPFKQRVRACQKVVCEIQQRTGRTIVYAPHISGTPEEIKHQIDFAQKEGVGSIMLAPMLVGLPFFHDLRRNHIQVPILAHPCFAGTARIREEALFGKLFRLFGADMVIFPNFGGRFSFSRSTCHNIAQTLRAPWSNWKPAFPVPAGGMTVNRVKELISFFGSETILLVGGSLLEAKDELIQRTREFVQAVGEVRHTLLT